MAESTFTNPESTTYLIPSIVTLVCKSNQKPAKQSLLTHLCYIRGDDHLSYSPLRWRKHLKLLGCSQPCIEWERAKCWYILRKPVPAVTHRRRLTLGILAEEPSPIEIGDRVLSPHDL